jgi:hypothetical protein
MSQTVVVPERPCEIIGVQGQVVVYRLEAGLEGQYCCRLCQTTSSKTRKLSDRSRRFSRGLSLFVPLYNQDDPRSFVGRQYHGLRCGERSHTRRSSSSSVVQVFVAQQVRRLVVLRLDARSRGYKESTGTLGALWEGIIALGRIPRQKNVIYYFSPKADEIGRGVVDLPGYLRAGLFDAESRLAIAGCMLSHIKQGLEGTTPATCFAWSPYISWGRRRMRSVTAKSLRAGKGTPASGGVRWLMGAELGEWYW